MKSPHLMSVPSERPLSRSEGAAPAGTLAEIIKFPKPAAKPEGWEVEGHVPCPFSLNRWCLRCDK